MNNEFVNYEQALALKELGFDEECFGFYFKEKEEEEFQLIVKGKTGVFFGYQFEAPLYQQAFRWFREQYDLQYNIVWNKFYDKTPYQYEVRPTWRDEILRPYKTSGMCNTYEQAELECLKKLIEIVKNK